MIKLMKECLNSRCRKFAFLGPMFVMLEVFFDIFIPVVMAKIIDVGIGDVENGGIGYIVKMGLLMVLLAGLALACGVLSSRCSSIASAMPQPPVPSTKTFISRSPLSQTWFSCS